METEFLRWLAERLPPHPRLRLGVGDDAAVIEFAGPECVVTCDLVADGVDFELSRCEPRRVGRKALAVNLSDLAAMASPPVAAIVGLSLPRDGALDLAIELYQGLLPLADEFEVAVAGGDINCWNGPLLISVTALGDRPPQGVWRRSTARPGDALLVTGAFGGSILGKHLDFTPRVREAAWLRQHAQVRAALDVSDGLSLDLWRLVQASGCGAVLDLEAVPIAAAARLRAAQTARSPLDHALGDGEDFELLFAAAPDEADRLARAWPFATPLTRVGWCVEESGLWKPGPGGQRAPLTPRGYEH